jgi:purine-binding chemotaxis protein CheW
MSAPAETPATGGEWEALARRAARARDEGDAPSLLRELLSFRLDEAPYAIPVERVREIVRHRRITPVPRVPAWVLGVVALRGEVVQVVDLRMRLGLRTAEIDRRTRIIVLHGDEDRVTGVLVDGVDQVLRVEEDAFRAATSGADSAAVSELCLREGVFVSVLDVDRVLELRAD